MLQLKSFVPIGTAYVWTVCSTLLYTACGSPLVLPCEKGHSSCGLPAVQPTSSRIIGGQPVEPGSWPWMVSVDLEGNHMCGGAIIAPDIVITAAHCFFRISFPLSISYLADSPLWTVRAGTIRLDRVEAGEVTVKVKEVSLHNGFNITSLANDTALLLLETPLKFSDLISPICLPVQGQGVKEGEKCMLAGWGETRGTAYEDYLNQVTLPVISDKTCGQPDWYGMWFSDPNTTFCAGYEKGQMDGCMGDSGGPLICWRDGVWTIQGISSWALECAEVKMPGVYTEVDKFVPWIIQKVGLLRMCYTEDQSIG